MRYFTEGLPKKQVSVLKKLGPQMSSREFYLAGETALSIYLRHRTSVDLDWFMPAIFEDAMLIAQALRNASIPLEVEQVSPGTLHGNVQGVRVTFLQYQYPLLHSLNYWSEMGCNLAALEDRAYQLQDVDGTLITPERARQIIAERYTVPEEVRKRNSKARRRERMET